MVKYTCFSCGEEYDFVRSRDEGYCNKTFCRHCFYESDDFADPYEEYQNQDLDNPPPHKKNERNTRKRSSSSYDKGNNKGSNKDTNKGNNKGTNTSNDKNRGRSNTSNKNNNKRDNSPISDNMINDIMKHIMGVDKIHFINMDLSGPSPKRAKRREDDTPTKEEVEPVVETQPDVSDFPFEWIGDEINGIEDLIKLGKNYNKDKKIKTNLDLWKCSKLVEPLEELQKMIGLSDIKESIFQQVVFHLQNLDDGNKDMHHTVIKGPPGVGKTQISHIIAKIYKGLGFLKKDKVVSVKRDDLIAGYLGQTAIKTKKKLEEALGGVLLIDEAYSLGDGGDKDSFSKEAVDLITSYLSEHGHEFICIIAGYKEALEKRFFSINEGLARRFTIHYEIKPYKGKDLRQIFFKVINDNGWKCFEEEITDEFFETHQEKFPNFGGDMLSLFSYSKKSHSKRLLKIRTYDELVKTKKVITAKDVDIGFKLYCTGNGYKNTEMTEAEKKFLMSMYT